MTQTPIPPSPRRPDWDTTPTAAVEQLRGRIFHLARSSGTYAVPQPLYAEHTGFALVDKNVAKKGLTDIYGTARTVTIADIAAYEKQVATTEEPLFYPDLGLFATLGNDTFYGDARTRNADLVVIPAGYIDAGEPAVLKAVRDASRAVDRQDVIASVALSVTWLRDPTIEQVIAILRTIQHPVALSLGAQGNPTDNYTSVVRNLRTLFAACPHVGLWRTDQVTGLDAMAHGALFAGIGAIATLRHLVPATQSGFAHSRYPSVYVPDLMAYYSADTLAARWANAGAHTCSCAVCDGKPLDRFHSLDKAIVEQAGHHNVAAWVQQWAIMAAMNREQQQNWLAEKLRRIGDAYQRENERIGQYKAFRPSGTLSKMIKMVASVSAEQPAQTPAR